MYYPDPASFPFFAVESLLEKGEDAEGSLTLMRRAVAAWRTAPTRETTDRFLSLLFGRRWELLPVEEARAVARDIVTFAQSEPDEPIHASYQSEGGVTITSMRTHTLFQILHVLRRLDPALAESLITEDEQFAVAARRFPNGIETIHDELQRRVAGAAGGRGFGMGGSRRDFAPMEALMQDSRDGDFGAALELALDEYREDTAPENPNQAPREFWPSTYRYRSILYRMGKQLGRHGAVYLDRIPDDDLRLFAEIEFEAALAGLPELNGIQMKYRPGRFAGK